MAEVGHSEAPRREDALQVLALLGGPAAVLASQQAKYLIVPWACGAQGGVIALHLTSLAAFLLAAGFGLLAARSWRRAGGGWPDDSGGERGRSRFLGFIGLLLCALSALVIFAQWLPDLLLSPCQV